MKEWRNVPFDCSLDCRRFKYMVVSFVYARRTMGKKENENEMDEEPNTDVGWVLGI